MSDVQQWLWVFRISLFTASYKKLHDSLGRDSSVGIATPYGMDGPGIKSRWDRDFPHPFGPTLGSTQPPILWVPGL